MLIFDILAGVQHRTRGEESSVSSRMQTL